MKVRRLEANDAQTAVAVVTQFAGKSVAPEYLKEFLANPANYLIVAEVDNQLAGFLLAQVLPRLKQSSYKMFIYEIEVDRAHQRKGIGSALIQFIREIARRQKMMKGFVFTNHSNKGAVEFYKSTGGRIANGDDLMFVYEE